MSERILIIDDQAGIRQTLRGILDDEGYRVDDAATAAEARRHLAAGAWDLVLLDLQLPDADGMELLAELMREGHGLPVIVISGHGNVNTAVRATRLGAYDFLEKPLSTSRILLTVQNALEKKRLAHRLAQLTDRYERAHVMVGDSAPMRQLAAELERAAASDSRILVIGENGTGKELVARRVHRLSQRASRPFVEVNCAAIPEDLIESELFGHVRGAFTGAAADRAGRFEQADGGTIFLDEIGDMSLKTQARVLRVLQEQRFERVGGSTSIQVDVRVVAATNKDLEAEIRAGRFREDLFFRLAVIPLEVPPLREREGDVPRLVEHFIAFFATELGRRRKQVGPQAMARLGAYEWPGNVRELRNLIERLMIMAPGDTIRRHDLPPQMRDGTNGRADALLDREFPSLRHARAAFEKRYIEGRLAACGGNVSRTAELLDLERSSLYRKIRAYGIELDDSRV